MARMHRLIYVSLASPDLENEDYANILNTARNFNELKGITGLLAYNGMNFMQVLEGPEDEVLDLYVRIARDHRHHGVIGIYAKTIDERAFPDWTMEYLYTPLRGNSIEALTQRNEKIDRKLPETVPDDIRELFANFNSLSVR